MMKRTIWIDSTNSFTAKIGAVGFLTNEPLTDGGPPSYYLRRQPLTDPDEQPVLRGHNGQYGEGIGLGRIARQAETTGRLCVVVLAATGEMLEELGYPELAEPPEFLTTRWERGHEPKEIRILLDQLEQIAGLVLIRPDGLAPSSSDLIRAGKVCASYHVALAEQQGRKHCPGGRWPKCEGQLED
jgi:hypothetical protein